MKYIPELNNLNFSEEKVTSPRFTQMPVISAGKPLDYIINEIDFKIESKEGYVVRLVDHPILIGIAATKLDLFDKYSEPCSSYIAIEIEYESIDKRLSNEDELKIFKAYLFELSHLCDNSIDFTIIRDSG
jgi:hypothetical protein